VQGAQGSGGSAFEIGLPYRRAPVDCEVVCLRARATSVKPAEQMPMPTRWREILVILQMHNDF